MRVLKLVLAVIIGLALMIIVAANMEPVDLELWPAQFGIGTLGLYGVPLALVIFVTLAIGFLLGMIVEWNRERSTRACLNRTNRRIAELESENQRLLRRTGAADDELMLIGGP